MANTEHLLKIKATLDTSEIQQKLDRLRSSQTNRAHATGNAVTANYDLSGVLSRLNASISRLQQSIESLNKAFIRPITTYRQPSMIMSAGGINTSTIQQLKQLKTVSQMQTQFKTLKPYSFKWERENGFKDTHEFRKARLAIINKNKSAWKNFLRGNITAQELMTQNTLMPGLGLAGDPIKQLEAYRATVQGRMSNLSLINQSRQPPKTRLTASRINFAKPTSNVVKGQGIQPGMVKAGIGFAVGQVMEGATQYAEATGHTRLAKGLSFGAGLLGTTTSGAVMGSLIPGVGTAVGAGIGAAVGTLKGAFELLADSAKDAAKALDEQKKSFFTGQAIDVGMYKFMQGQNDKAALKKKDVSYFEQRLADAQDLNERQRKALEQEVGLDLGKGKRAQFNLREYEKTTLEMMKGGMKEDDPEIIRRKNVAKLYQANAKGFQESTSDIENLKEVLEEFKKTATLKTLNTELDKLQEVLSSTKAPSMDQVNSLASQGFMIDASDDQQRYQAQIDYLKQIADLTRQIKDKQEQIKTVEIR